MNLKQTMATLKKLGTAQSVKIYKRHGAGDNLFGVSFADLNVLKKKIKIDHDLAAQLWKTGNTDAQSLATMIADPEEFTPSSADAWLRDISCYYLGGLFAGLIARSKIATSRVRKWTKSKKETVRQAGYDLICVLLRNDADALPDDECRSFLATIRKEIHGSPNRARHAMNMALTAVGIYKPSLRAEAIAAARQIGKVEVDHGQTSCKTPDAEAYINKAAARKPPKRKRKTA